MLHNEHVYIYYRWYTWVAGKISRPFAEELYRHWAEDEKENQEKG